MDFSPSTLTVYPELVLKKKNPLIYHSTGPAEKYKTKTNKKVATEWFEIK